MAGFRLVISDPETGRAIQYELDESKKGILIGRRVGEIIDGNEIGISGYKLKITGGSDLSGFPIRPDVHGPGKKRILLSSPPGYHPKKKGVRRRKTVRGNEISHDIVQINMKIIEKGKKPLEELISGA